MMVKVLYFLVIVVVANARTILLEEVTPGHFIPVEYDEELESAYQPRVRERRQLHGNLALNSDGSSGANVRLPIAGNANNQLSAIGGVNLDSQKRLTAATAGLALDNVNGHSLSLSQTMLPGVGSRATAAGSLRLGQAGPHTFDANAFAARTTLNHVPVPSFNTYGGGLDYSFKDKAGLGFNVARTPFLQQTDYSATARLNAFRGRDSSLDFNAGLSKSVSPFQRSNWEPFTGFTFKKYF